MNKRVKDFSSRGGSHQESSLAQFAAKAMFAIVYIVMLLTLAQCTIKKPEAPEWNTQLTIPLVHRTYQMAEIIDKIDQEGISIDSLDNVVFSFNQETDTATLDTDKLTTPALSYFLSQQLGLVSIVPPVIAPVDLAISSIAPLAAAIPGNIPAMNFQVDNNLPSITSFSSVTIANGQLYVVIDNTLGIDLDVVTVDLFDQSGPTLISSQSFPTGIPSGTVDSVAISLNGRTISNNLLAQVSCHTPGGSVLSASNKSLSTAVHFSSLLNVSAATAEIPALNRNFSQQIQLNETDAVHSATLSNGTLSLTITNTTPLQSSVTLTFPDLELNGTPLSLIQSVNPNGNTVANINLANYTLSPNDLSVPQQIAVIVVAAVPSTAPSQVTVDQSQQFSVTAQLDNLTFGSVTGVFAATNATIDPIVKLVNVPTGFDAVTLTSGILTIEIENAVGLPGSLDLVLNGSNGKSLNIGGAVAPKSGGSATVTVLIDTTVADFMTPLPDSVVISGTATFGNGSTVGTISAGDYIFATIGIFAPLEVILTETTIETDIESQDIEQDNIDAITDHVVEARFIYSITNHLPLGVRVNIFLGGDSATVASAPLLAFDTIAILAAPVVGGIVSDTISTGYRTIILDSADIQVLKNNPLFIATELVLSGSNGQPIKLTTNDYITINARIEVEYRFDGEF
ncbi:MAG: hypothetical protein SGI97_00450 [candidate division Zixibacteria bacterium]|nr:hypothetical protein [candidate division Zixibacteria bacterium]